MPCVHWYNVHNLCLCGGRKMILTFSCNSPWRWFLWFTWANAMNTRIDETRFHFFLPRALFALAILIWHSHCLLARIIWSGFFFFLSTTNHHHKIWQIKTISKWQPITLFVSAHRFRCGCRCRCRRCRSLHLMHILPRHNVIKANIIKHLYTFQFERNNHSVFMFIFIGIYYMYMCPFGSFVHSFW